MPRVVVVGGKAASAYVNAKKIVKLVNAIGKVRTSCASRHCRAATFKPITFNACMLCIAQPVAFVPQVPWP